MSQSKISIKVARKKCGYTREGLAIKLGVTPKDIEEWENDGNTILPLHLYALSAVFNIPINYLRMWIFFYSFDTFYTFIVFLLCQKEFLFQS